MQINIQYDGAALIAAAHDLALASEEVIAGPRRGDNQRINLAKLQVAKDRYLRIETSLHQAVEMVRVNERTR